MQICNDLTKLAIALTATIWIAGCSDSSSPEDEGSNTHADGTVHRAGENEEESSPEKEAHGHDDDVALPPITIDGMKVELSQGNGGVEAGKENYLVVKLPYSDNGATIVRAWIGTEDRTLSYVGKGDYAPTHGDYDIHATAPNPLPANPMWWIEIVKPDGTKLIGSTTPISD